MTLDAAAPPASATVRHPAMPGTSPRTATRVGLGLVGPGNVGRALLAQLGHALPRHPGLDLRLHAVAGSGRMRLAADPLDPAATARLVAADQPADLDRLADHLCGSGLPHAVLVDCTASEEVAARYPGWLARGLHVVTPSKHAGSGPLALLEAIRAAQARGGTQFRYEATVGAGLPVVQTLRSLLDTGDELLEIEGVLSGTLAWLFNRFDGTRPFSALVRDAHALGYTEPDPRDDLSGLDVARKLVILAREAGQALSLEQVEVEDLVPVALHDVPLEEFLARLPELDAAMQARLADSRASGRGLRHLARLDRSGRATVGLATPDAAHPSLHGRLTDNLIQFRTRRYSDNPLVVQGPGAGPEVTAAGVFADLLAVCRSPGAAA